MTHSKTKNQCHNDDKSIFMIVYFAIVWYIWHAIETPTLKADLGVALIYWWVGGGGGEWALFS